MGIIYLFTNLQNNKKYVGQTINPQQRYNAHKGAAFNVKNSEYNSPLHAAMRKYGFENFSYTILAESDSVDELNTLEKYYIKELNTKVPNGYNILDGGKDASTHHWTEEEKEKIRERSARLTKDEVIYLRKAYLNKESPTKIYKDKYEGKMHYNSFLNIWTGQRYAHIMPEVFIGQTKHTKLTLEQVKEIKEALKNGATQKSLAEKYHVCRTTIGNISRGTSWKDA